MTSAPMTCDECGLRFDESDADKSEITGGAMCPGCGAMDLTLSDTVPATPGKKERWRPYFDGHYWNLSREGADARVENTTPGDELQDAVLCRADEADRLREALTIIAGDCADDANRAVGLARQALSEATLPAQPTARQPTDKPASPTRSGQREA